MSARGSDVKVFVRTRPTSNFAKDLIQYLPDGQTVNVHMKKDCQKGIVNNQICSWSFRLDQVLHDASQEMVYDRVARGVVLQALDGYNGTIMCFGQTGAGKTYTITGATASYKQRGIIPRALQEVFQEVEHRTNSTFTIHLSFLEIYNEVLLDLLSSVEVVPGRESGPTGGMSIMEEAGGSVSVRGLSMHSVHTEEEALNLLFEGEMNRIIGAHALNRNSSRSHCIFSIHIESRSRTLSEAKYVTSKLNLVDLAGSERFGKTGSKGQVLKEAMYINKSLSFLEQAILALADRRRDHVPFRQSKLTHALKDSLGGNCNTVLVANIYGDAAQIEETLSTLRFASRMKRVRTEPGINELIDPMLQMRKLQKENQLLKQELLFHDMLASRTGVSYDALTDKQVAEIQRQVRSYLDGVTNEIDILNIRQIQEVFAQFRLALQQQVKMGLKVYNSLAEKTAGSPDAAGKMCADKTMVGEPERGGFGLGIAPSSERHARPQSPQKAKSKKGKELSTGRKAGGASPTHGKETGTNPVSDQPAPQRDLELETQDQKIQGSQSAETQQFEAHTPPPKAEAFEEFKAEQGKEINCILKENKSVLLDRRQRLRVLADAVNVTKQDIDQTGNDLQLWREQNQGKGSQLSAEEIVGMEREPVMEEAELALVLRLQELKMQYRRQYEELRSAKAEINYCEHLVDQCRRRLLTEFEIWYDESFLIPKEVQAVLQAGGSIRPGLIPVENALSVEKDAQEHFEHLRYEMLPDGPRSIPYYSAQSRTTQRQNNRAMSKIQLQTRKAERKGQSKHGNTLSVA